MFDAMNQSANAIEVYTKALNVHNANIANMSVVGYKSLDVSFQSILENVLRPGTAASSFSSLGGTNPLQFGQGVAIANIGINFNQGDATQSNNNTDLYINGRGLFIVSDDDGQTYQYTRSGKFGIDSNGNLITDKGMQVFGLNASGSLTPIKGLTGALTDYTWDNGTGELLYQGASTGYRIAMTYFNNQGALTQASATTFKESLASGSSATPVAPGGAAGTITSGYLEASNVSYTNESIDSLEMQRALSANLSAVKAASDIIASVINKLG